MIEGVSVSQPLQPSLEATSPDPCNLIVNYIPTPVNDEYLRELFEPFGTIVSARVIVDRTTNHPKGYGFVKYTTKEAAKKAIKEMNGYKLQNKHLRVTQANGPQNHSHFPNDFSSSLPKITPTPPPVVHFLPTSAALQNPQPQYALLGSEHQILCASHGAQPLYYTILAQQPQAAAPTPMNYVLHSGQGPIMCEPVVVSAGATPQKTVLPSGAFSGSSFCIPQEPISCFPTFSPGFSSGQFCSTVSSPASGTSTQGLTTSSILNPSPSGPQNLELSTISQL